MIYESLTDTGARIRVGPMTRGRIGVTVQEGGFGWHAELSLASAGRLAANLARAAHEAREIDARAIEVSDGPK